MKLNKRNNSNKLVIPILILSLLFISIGYSYLQTTLSIDGNVSFDICMKNTHKVTILGQTMTYYDDDKCSEFVSSKNGIRFDNEPSDTNGKGLYLRAGTENDEYPIYYYRGGDDLNNDGLEDFINNHVLFGGFCWKIVRTTEKGGTKLIYDGLPNENNECVNINANTLLEKTSIFNQNYSALADIGYMYGERYPTVSWTDQAFIYGNDITYSDGVYTLIEPTETADTLENNPKLHYTCKFDERDKCDVAYYVYKINTNSKNIYAVELKNGKKLQDIIDDSYENKNDSEVKQTIDTWFKENLTNEINSSKRDYKDYLEDAVWCNDRSIAKGGYLSKDSAATITYFGAFGTRSLSSTSLKPALKDEFACPNKNDRFTTNDVVIGNGKLKYSIGMLTADEVAVAGNGWNGYSNKTYLYNGQYYWTLSPYSSSINGYSYFGLFSVANKFLYYTYVGGANGVRPSIVLKYDIVATSGDGSSEHPYVVE